MPEEQRLEHPIYYGEYKHVDRKGGYAVWIPAGWTHTKMKRGRHGHIFHPDANDLDTCFIVEKHKLKYSVTEKDIPTLREGFKQGLEALPGIEIEWQEETITELMVFWDAKFTFLEGDKRRKRWLRNMYWGNGQLVLIAQGATPEEFEYYLPMFYNTMMTIEL